MSTTTNPQAPTRTEKELIAASRPYASESKAQSWTAVLVTLVVLVGFWSGAALAPHWALRVVFGILAGLTIVRMFILYHDYMHGAILRGSALAKALFYVYGVVVMTPPRVWRDTHNYHHANTAKIIGSHVGSYMMVTTGMWAKMSSRERFMYKAVRHPLTILFGYFTVFMLGMCVSPFVRAPKKNWDSAVSLRARFTVGSFFSFGAEIDLMRGGRALAAVVGSAALLATTSAYARSPSPPREVSPFFPSLDELCQVVRGGAQSASVRDDIRSYCADHAQVPAFAADRESERLAMLDEQRALAGLKPSRLISVPAIPPVRALVDLVPIPDDAKPPGDLTLEALALTIQEGCSPKAVAETLPNTCASVRRRPFSLVSLRSALVDDAAALASKGLAELGRVPALETAVATLSLVAAFLEGDEIPQLLSRVDALVERKASGASGSSAIGAAAAVATEIVVRVLRDGPVLDKPRAHYERVVAAVLSERIKVGRVSSSNGPAALPLIGFLGDPKSEPPALTPEQTAATSKLVAAIATLEQGRRAVSQRPATERDIAALVLASFDVIEGAHALAKGESRPISPEARAVVARVVSAAVTGNVRAVADVIADQLDAFERSGNLSSNAVCTSKTALRVAFTTSDAEMRRALLTCLVELPPWTDKLLFAAHAGLPVFDATTTRIDADLLLGYNGDSFGISGFGSVYNYDFVDASGRSETFRTEGSGDIWGSLKIGEKARIEGRLSGGGALYNTDVYPAARGYYEETSVMGRGSALLGVRLVPSTRFVVAAHAGGGFQVEIWDGTQIPANGRRIVISDEIPVTARAVARLRGQWLAWPRALSFRVSGDFDYLSITRATEVTTIGPAGVSTTISEASVKQAELFARAYADIDYLEFFGFRPVIHGGTNVVNVGGATAVVPVFGLGIRRETF